MAGYRGYNSYEDYTNNWGAWGAERELIVRTGYLLLIMWYMIELVLIFLYIIYVLVMDLREYYKERSIDEKTGEETITITIEKTGEVNPIIEKIVMSSIVSDALESTLEYIRDDVWLAHMETEVYAKERIFNFVGAILVLPFTIIDKIYPSPTVEVQQDMQS